MVMVGQANMTTRFGGFLAVAKIAIDSVARAADSHE
jgi:hypothetical protein